MMCRKSCHWRLADRAVLHWRLADRAVLQKAVSMADAFEHDLLLYREMLESVDVFILTVWS